eukprot:750457-Hanusia_phi.AAC.1
MEMHWLQPFTLVHLLTKGSALILPSRLCAVTNCTWVGTVKGSFFFNSAHCRNQSRPGKNIAFKHTLHDLLANTSFSPQPKPCPAEESRQAPAESGLTPLRLSIATAPCYLLDPRRFLHPANHRK